MKKKCVQCGKFAKLNEDGYSKCCNENTDNVKIIIWCAIGDTDCLTEPDQNLRDCDGCIK